MARENDDLVSEILQADGSVDDQPLGAANAQIRVQEDDGLLLLCCLLRRHISGEFRLFDVSLQTVTTCPSVTFLLPLGASEDDYLVDVAWI